MKSLIFNNANFLLREKISYPWGSSRMSLSDSSIKYIKSFWPEEITCFDNRTSLHRPENICLEVLQYLDNELQLGFKGSPHNVYKKYEQYGFPERIKIFHQVTYFNGIVRDITFVRDKFFTGILFLSDNF